MNLLSTFTKNPQAIKVSAANARLQFHGCTPEFIRDVCHSACCDTRTPGGKGILVSLHVNEAAALAARGARIVLGPDNAIMHGDAGLSGAQCRFKTEEHLCGLHFEKENGEKIKPWTCRAAPWHMNKTGTLVIRNHYKLLKCYKAGPLLPAYVAFREGLNMIFGDKEAERIVKHFEEGGDDIYAVPLASSIARVRARDEAVNKMHNEKKAGEFKQRSLLDVVRKSRKKQREILTGAIEVKLRDVDDLE